MYIPFGTMHHVVAGQAMSSHLTVNVERQFHTWASLLRSAMVLLAFDFRVPVNDFVDSVRHEEAAMLREGAEEDPFVVLCQRAREVIELARAPRGSMVIQGSIANDDLPAGFLAQMASELKDIAAKLLPFAEKRESTLSVQYGHQMKNHRLSKMLPLLQQNADRIVPWLVEVDRLRRFMGLTGHASVPSPREVFGSIAKLRSKAVGPHIQGEVTSPPP